MPRNSRNRIPFTSNDGSRTDVIKSNRQPHLARYVADAPTEKVSVRHDDETGTIQKRQTDCHVAVPDRSRVPSRPSSVQDAWVRQVCDCRNDHTYSHCYQADCRTRRRLVRRSSRRRRCPGITHRLGPPVRHAWRTRRCRMQAGLMHVGSILLVLVSGSGLASQHVATENVSGCVWARDRNLPR